MIPHAKALVVWLVHYLNKTHSFSQEYHRRRVSLWIPLGFDLYSDKFEQNKNDATLGES